MIVRDLPPTDPANIRALRPLHSGNRRCTAGISLTWKHCNAIRRVDVSFDRHLYLQKITAAGRKQLAEEKRTFEFLLAGIARVMEAS